ncbi:hypothetical protein MSIBF_A980001 [groundwater metagenome]|uniref:Uncharacterized protein n=1 Tax=groundwater metagenome TaxID=717931 RepID=A0A098EEW3_9ZZZZ
MVIITSITFKNLINNFIFLNVTIQRLTKFTPKNLKKLSVIFRVAE